ncbi:Rad4-domain-containing protein [Lojkania enalia]|uniref:Rad4-domain-containing protein n=1 Tax=Lojkania enalia TaxID=147567 RepID=A0A9P4K5K3_9PLEO|nr:Rad4-domain-containing protein [Didymosphaeria enalia]
MAGTRGKLRKLVTGAMPRRSTRRGRVPQGDAEVPEVFQDMLSEARASKAAGPEEDEKPLKKRRTAQTFRDTEVRPVSSVQGQIIPTSDESQPSQSYPRDHSISDLPEPDVGRADAHGLQTVTDSEESEGSDSDIEWEDVLAEEQDNDDAVEPEIGDLSITIGDDKDEEKTTKRVKRRGITSIEKKLRLDIHKMHILCLLYHVHRRNAWCNDEKVQSTLRKLPSPKTLSNLIPNPDFTQYQASKRFIEGLGELKVLWANRFSVNAQGMHKPRWADADADALAFSHFDEFDSPMDKQDFRKAASTLQGSQDVGAQLFCALLRAIGIETRLVCSLQCLPFASAAQTSTPQKLDSQKNIVHLDPYNTQQSFSKPKANTPSRPKRMSRLERVLGERNPALSSGVAPKQKNKYHSPYPVYWAEVFNPTAQKWIPIDPLSTFTIDKPDKLEPPLSFSQNSLVYVVAFEDDSTARDVTRRYAKAYNAKTRKFRVESTEGGLKWWKRALKDFRRTTVLDRDQVEDATLARKEAAEGMPKNVQDYKDHPVYVLGRHLRHNEVIYPMHQIGKVNIGSSMNPRMEPIYRRKDVHIVRSADKWYRMGRDVKAGEQPLKHAKPKKDRRQATPSVDLNEQQEEVGVGLYAFFQTELYVPPSVVHGRVPRNAFGNLDLYVPSMVPEGGVHIRHQLAAKAARIVGVDFAEAVTGFSFKGRHGTAIVQGVVVAREYKEAVEAVIDSLEYSQEEAKNSQRSAEALRLWRRFYLGLRIAQRVNAIEIDGETGPVINVQEQIEREDKEIAQQQLAGGFFPKSDNAVELTLPITQHKMVSHNENMGGGFLLEDDEGGGGFLHEDYDRRGEYLVDQSSGFGSSLLAEQRLRLRQNDEFEGRFAGDNNEDAGGFIHESPVAVPGSPAGGIATDCDFVQTDGAADDNFAAEPLRHSSSSLDSSRGKNLVPLTEEEQRAESSLRFDNDEDTKAPVPTIREVIPQPVVPRNPSPPPLSPSEAGSLPLEDPEDEDADPDWLVDVT